MSVILITSFSLCLEGWELIQNPASLLYFIHGSAYNVCRLEECDFTQLSFKWKVGYLDKFPPFYNCEFQSPLQGIKMYLLLLIFWGNSVPCREIEEFPGL